MSLRNQSQPSAARSFLIGPFAAMLRATSFAEGSDLPDRLFASLLTQAPGTGRHGYVESPRTAGERRPVRWSRVDSRMLVIPHAFGFVIPGSGLVEELALFDGDGRMMFHGPLRSQRQALERPERFEFPEGSVRLMHARPAAPQIQA
ncbi:MAG TPA: hypothetical protein PLQ03_06525 [Brevundimonas sp.]|uniref:hypothetical protein n=1 Tax=Brevundimonas sp. TaxID=1871086 RepID=UPI00260700F0|nr:hypothetical protein [Brevundimonas sp.]HRO33052.1 hypothetical protein [Brevundimonas sp.]